MNTKGEQRLIIRSGGSARVQTRVSRSCACSCKLQSEFRDLQLAVSVRDWSAMFARDGEE